MMRSFAVHLLRHLENVGVVGIRLPAAPKNDSLSA